MGELIRIKDITDWDAIFDMTYEYLSFLLYDAEISAELVARTTHDILKNCGYNYSYSEILKHYHHIA